MTDQNTQPGLGAGPIPFIEVLVGSLLQANVALPIAFELVRTIVALFRDRNPDEPLPTDGEVIKQLREKAQADRVANEEWLAAHPEGSVG